MAIKEIYTAKVLTRNGSFLYWFVLMFILVGCKSPEEFIASCGNTLHEGEETRIRWKSGSVPLGSTCESQEQVRVCDNGTFSGWTGNYTELECKVEGAKSCGDTPHGSSESRVRWQAASVPFGSTCESQEQVRVCDNGTFGDWTGNYTELECKVEGAKSCGDTPHGSSESRVRWQAASVPFGSTCESQEQVRVCDNGTFGDWTGNCAELECKVEGAKSCGDTPHGNEETRIRWKATTVPYGLECESETQARICNNGVFSKWTGTYKESNCHVMEPAHCDKKPHGGERTRTRWQKVEVYGDEICLSETQTQFCDNGQWSDWSGSFEEVSCAVCADGDGDRYGPGCLLGEDCNDYDGAVNPGMQELPWDGMDNNCDGQYGSDLLPLSQSGGDVFAIRAVDGFVYAAVGTSFIVLDYNDIEGPPVGELSFTENSVLKIAIQEKTAYLMLSSGFIVVVDVSNPEVPIELHRTPYYQSSWSSVTQMEIANGRLWVSSIRYYVYQLYHEVTMDIFSISADRTLRQLYSENFWISNYDVVDVGRFVVGREHLYIASNNGMLTYSILEDGKLEYLSIIDKKYIPMQIRGETLYASGDSKAVAFDVHDGTLPNEPSLSELFGDRLHVTSENIYGFVNGLKSSDQLLYAIPTDAFETATANLALTLPNMGYISDLDGDDEGVVVAQNGAISAIDFKESSGPTMRNSRRTLGNASRLKIYQEHAYIVDGNGISIVNVTNLQKPSQPLFVPLAQQAVAIEVHNGIAFVAVEKGLAIVDVHDPEKPGVPFYVPLEQEVFDLAVMWNYWSNDHYVVLVGANHLTMIDIGNPQSPGPPRTLWLSYMNAKSVVVRGAEAYVLYETTVGYPDRYQGVMWVSLSDPENPKVIERIQMIKPALETLAVTEDYVIVAGLYDILLYRRGNAEYVTSVTNTGAGRIFAHGDRIYGVEGLYFLMCDINKSTSPVCIKLWRSALYANDIFADDNHLYLLGGQGLGIFELHNATILK